MVRSLTLLGTSLLAVSAFGAPTKLAPTETYKTTVTDIQVKPINPDIDKEHAAVEATLTFKTPAPNCGAVVEYDVKDVHNQEYISANNMKDGKLRVIGEDQLTFKTNFVPALRGYSVDDIKGANVTVRSFSWTAKVLKVKKVEKENAYLETLVKQEKEVVKNILESEKLLQDPNLTEEQKTRLTKTLEGFKAKSAQLVAEIKRESSKKYYELTFDSSFPSKKSQLVVTDKDKREYLDLDAKGYSPQYSDVKTAQWTADTPNQVPSPEKLVGKSVTVCSYSSLWHAGFMASWGK